VNGGEAVAVLAVLFSAMVLAAAGIAGRRLFHTRRSSAEATVRPLLFRSIDTGEVDVHALKSLRTVERQALHRQATALLPQLRGQDHEHLARLLESNGEVHAAHRQLRSPSAAARARATRFLGETGRPAAVEDLVRALRDPKPSVRWSAARSLGRLGHPAAVTPLLGSLEGDRPIPPDVVIEAIAQIRTCPVAVLRQGLRSRSAPIRAVSVELLGRFQALAAGPDVIALLSDDPSIEVRTRAAQSLGRMGLPRAVGPLLESLHTGPAPMHPQVVWALGEIGSEEAVPALREALTGPSAQVRSAAALALQALRSPAVTIAGVRD
jgi:HEAT repeat protein